MVTDKLLPLAARLSLRYFETQLLALTTPCPRQSES
jgi:hypothetical protein